MTSYAVLDRHRKEIELSQGLVGMQIVSIMVVAVAALAVGLIEWIWPNFFNYPYASWNVAGSDIMRFWPLFLYSTLICGAVNLIAGNTLRSSEMDEKMLSYGIFTGVLAGIWEEIGYRCVFICMAMISVMVSNWMLGTVFVLVIAAFLTISALQQFRDEEPLLGGIFAILAVAAVVLWTKFNDPVYWLMEHITFPILNFLSIGALAPILNGPDALFVMGAVAANAWFRDGHKYQGPVGYFNSWFVGFVLLYAAFTYGLLVAIVVHALYNIVHSLTRYSFRKFNG